MKTFNIISGLIVVFYLLVFLSFLLISCEKKYSLSTKEIFRTMDVGKPPSYCNYRIDMEVFVENPALTFYKKSESPMINKNTY